MQPGPVRVQLHGQKLLCTIEMQYDSLEGIFCHEYPIVQDNITPSLFTILNKEILKAPNLALLEISNGISHHLGKTHLKFQIR